MLLTLGIESAVFVCEKIFIIITCYYNSTINFYSNWLHTHFTLNLGTGIELVVMERKAETLYQLRQTGQKKYIFFLISRPKS